MKRTLAVLATAGALAATTLAAPAPAEARGSAPDWHSAWPRAHSSPVPPLARTGHTTTGQAMAIMDITGRSIMSLTPITGRTIGTTTGALTGNRSLLVKGH